MNPDHIHTSGPKQRGLEPSRVARDPGYLTTRQGARVDHTDDSLGVGERGRTPLEDFHAREKIDHFDQVAARLGLAGETIASSRVAVLTADSVDVVGAQRFRELMQQSGAVNNARRMNYAKVVHQGREAVPGSAQEGRFQGEGRADFQCGRRPG
jgi:hypothetical protein